MRVLRALAVAAAACAAVGLSTPLATADAAGGPPPGVGAQGGPPPAPGRGGNGSGNGPSNVTVNPYSVHQGATMQVSAAGCGHGGTVWSHGNFPQTNLSAGSIGFATVRIFNHASPGNHTLSVKCHDNSLVATHRFTILRGNGAQGGIGGSIGPSAAETAIGAGLVGTAALGAGIHVMRRRRPSGATG
ncbi:MULTISPECIES: hypothetical protein [unclassified Streptomyces]|uniref:hypothetical protein n=1 Tax=unclassified Streptomyces TaxID=2593676 RepID=UPI00224F1FC1|nr:MULTISPECIES: hypothetical protein [unclassified Streptomyces]MCX4529456.1 hypothetical protein [Streptomyces sp. NBC_01551]MCX4539994.1 hypothetical protein [Streptomyces sp. NBC_01565]